MLYFAGHQALGRLSATVPPEPIAEGRPRSCSFAGKRSVVFEGVPTLVSSPPRSGTEPRHVNSIGDFRHRTSYRLPVHVRWRTPNNNLQSCAFRIDTLIFACRILYPQRRERTCHKAYLRWPRPGNIALCGPWPDSLSAIMAWGLMYNVSTSASACFGSCTPRKGPRYGLASVRRTVGRRAGRVQ